RDDCSLNGYLNKLQYGDEPTCEMRLSIDCVGFLDAKGTGQTPAKIQACVAAFPSYACTDFRDNSPPTACLVTGMLGNGMACGANGQCTSGYCNVASTKVCGTCEALPLAGTMCNTAADCGHDLACALATGAVAGTCAPYVTQGSPCLTGVSPCEEG